MPSKSDIHTVRQWLKEIMSPENIDWETYTRLRAVCRILDKLEYCHRLIDATGIDNASDGLLLHDRVETLVKNLKDKEHPDE